MIYIKQGSRNTVIVTGTELVTIAYPFYFLFEFYDMASENYYYCTGPDSSGYQYRFNQFNITEKSNPNLTNNEVYLPGAGEYQYIIYQQSSPVNLDPAQTNGIVETGILKVISNATVTPDIVYHAAQSGSIIYGN